MTSARKLLAVQPAHFSPDSITGLIGWWDASDTATITDTGGLVDTWADKSPVGNDATGVTTTRPTTGATTRNGRNVIDFPSAHSYLTLGSAIAYSRTAPMTVFIVANKADVTNKQVVVSGSSTIELGPTPVWAYGPPYAYAPAYTAGTWDVFTGSTVAGDGYDALYLRLARRAAFGATSTFFGATAKDFTHFGYPPNAAYSLQGSIGEVLFYNSELSNTDRTAVEAYLMNKWGTP